MVMACSSHRANDLSLMLERIGFHYFEVVPTMKINDMMQFSRCSDWYGEDYRAFHVSTFDRTSKGEKWIN